MFNTLQFSTIDSPTIVLLQLTQHDIMYDEEHILDGQRPTKSHLFLG